MAIILLKSASNVWLLQKNIHADGELGETATTEESSVVQTEGSWQIRQTLRHSFWMPAFRLATNSILGGCIFLAMGDLLLEKHVVRGFSVNKEKPADRDHIKCRILDLLARTHLKEPDNPSVINLLPPSE